VPKLAANLDYARLYQSVLTAVGNALFKPGWRDMLMEFKRNPIRADFRNIADWVMRLDDKKRALVEKAEILGIEEVNPGNFRLTVKAALKPKLTGGSYKPSQTLVYNWTDTNMAFTGAWNELHRRFTSLFKDNVRLGTRKSPKEVEEWMRLFSRYGEKYEEMDISQFDKSEGENCMEGIEKPLVLDLGLDPEVAALWYDPNEEVKITSVAFNFRIFLQVQRRSGQLSTLLGNSIVTAGAVCLAMALDRVEFYWFFFQGDDSLVAVKRHMTLTGVSERASTLFNLMMKHEQYEHGYCCSRFALRVKNQMHWVYDPMLYVAKMSRSISLLDRKNLGDRLRSARDTVVHLQDDVIAEALVPALCERYRIPESVARIGILAVRSHVHNERAYDSVHMERSSWL
jgi:hypothetical protein